MKGASEEDLDGLGRVTPATMGHTDRRDVHEGGGVPQRRVPGARCRSVSYLVEFPQPVLLQVLGLQIKKKKKRRSEQGHRAEAATVGARQRPHCWAGRVPGGDTPSAVSRRQRHPHRVAPQSRQPREPQGVPENREPPRAPLLGVLAPRVRWRGGRGARPDPTWSPVALRGPRPLGRSPLSSEAQRLVAAVSDLKWERSRTRGTTV